MNPELRNRALMVGLLLVAWALLVYLKTVLNASVLPDLNAIIAQVQVLMGGVVGYHVGTGASVPGAVLPALTAFAPASTGPAGQGGFIRLRLLSALVAIAIGLALFAGCAAAPSGDQVQALRNACAVDAGLRPSVTVLLAIPGIAKPEELAAVAAARAVIDPVCANPGGDVQANSVAAVTSASASLVGLVAEMQARKAAAPSSAK